jgi:hypothetical protein
MNKAEELVNKLCTKSFLSLWSYPNPQGKDSGKELCDILVVCEPDVIIFSVKEIGLTNSGDVSVDWKRWLKRAIEDSAKQIYGAERWIKQAKNVIKRDGKRGLPFPDVTTRRTHRVAVALGGEEEVPLYFGDLGRGFVHVFGEVSLEVVMNELDTITDFVNYLRDKEDLYHKGVKITFIGGEEDLLALYLQQGRSFPVKWDAILLDEGMWRGFSRRPEYKAKKEADRDSYFWDRLVEIICDDFYADELQLGSALCDIELALRTMARENRFARRVLAKSFLNFISLKEKKIRARISRSPSGMTYVFLARPHGEDRDYRRKELVSRCFVARGLHPDQTTVIGIATEEYEPTKGFSVDVAFFSQRTWTTEDQEKMDFLQREMGFFASPIKTKSHEDEYPNAAKP